MRLYDASRALIALKFFGAIFLRTRASELVRKKRKQKRVSVPISQVEGVGGDKESCENRHSASEKYAAGR